MEKTNEGSNVLHQNYQSVLYRKAKQKKLNDYEIKKNIGKAWHLLETVGVLILMIVAFPVIQALVVKYHPVMKNQTQMT